MTGSKIDTLSNFYPMPLPNPKDTGRIRQWHWIKVAESVDLAAGHSSCKQSPGIAGRDDLESPALLWVSIEDIWRKNSCHRILKLLQSRRRCSGRDAS